MTTEKVTLITPTADQPKGMALAEWYMNRQTVPFDQWIVADDGEQPANLTMGQDHVVRPRQHEGARSLAANMLAALPLVRNGIVIIIEHDDWYAPNHIEVCLQQLRDHSAVGSRLQRYYNVDNQHFRVMTNIGSALCNTALRAPLIPMLAQAAQRAFDRNAIGLDRLFWDSVGGHVHDIHTVVGIKGLPGRVGLGIGHKPPNEKWAHDPDLAQLREWIGDDVKYYQ
jgi:hypothetical protein